MSVPANDSALKYTSKQMDRALKRLKERKDARRRARDEEKCYVEYRKQQFLAASRPTVGTLRSGDDVFPKRRRGSMGFGERQAHFLSIRPNPRFATWIGKTTGIIEAKPQVFPQTAQVTDHSALPQADGRVDIEQSVKGKRSDEKIPVKVDKGGLEGGIVASPNIITQAKVDGGKKEKLGNRAENPLVNGVPFWLVQNANEPDEITDEDLPVDMEILERVCNGDLTLAQKPFQKTKFNPFGTVQKFKFDDALFARDSTLFASTVEAPDEDVVYPAPPGSLPRLVKWSDKIQVTYYDPTDRDQPIELLTFEDMKDVKRDGKPEKK